MVAHMYKQGFKVSVCMARAKSTGYPAGSATYQGNTDSIIMLTHDDGDDGRSKEKEDQGILIEALEELEVDGFLIVDLKLVETIAEPAVVGLLSGQTTGGVGLELERGLLSTAASIGCRGGGCRGSSSIGLGGHGWIAPAGS